MISAHFFPPPLSTDSHAELAEHSSQFCVDCARPFLHHHRHRHHPPSTHLISTHKFSIKTNSGNSRRCVTNDWRRLSGSFERSNDSEKGRHFTHKCVRVKLDSNENRNTLISFEDRRANKLFTIHRTTSLSGAASFFTIKMSSGANVEKTQGEHCNKWKSEKIQIWTRLSHSWWNFRTEIWIFYLLSTRIVSGCSLLINWTSSLTASQWKWQKSYSFSEFSLSCVCHSPAKLSIFSWR